MKKNLAAMHYYRRQMVIFTQRSQHHRYHHSWLKFTICLKRPEFIRWDIFTVAHQNCDQKILVFINLLFLSSWTSLTTWKRKSRRNILAWQKMRLKVRVIAQSACQNYFPVLKSGDFRDILRIQLALKLYTNLAILLLYAHAWVHVPAQIS